MMRNIRILLPAILALSVIVVEMALNLFGSNIQIALWLAVLLLFLQVGILFFDSERVKNIRPKIEPYEIPFADMRPMIQTKGKKTQMVGPLIFFHMRFSNNPVMRVEQATARKVFAQISYYNDSKRRLVGPIFGRWGDTEQPGTRSPFDPNRDLLSVDLESSGLPRELNLALKYPDENVIYAFNNDSYVYSGWKNPSFILKEKQVFIHVRLSGENVDDSDLWILLENKGKSLTLQPTSPLDLPKDEDRTNWIDNKK